MKKIVSGLLTLSILSSMAVGARAQEDIKVYVGDKQIAFDVAPIIENERTLVPMRTIFEELGAEVTWDGATKVITAVKDDVTVELKIGSDKMTKTDDGKADIITLDVPAKIVDERTLVPLRAVSEAFDSDVKWDGETRTITITLSDYDISEIKMIDMEHHIYSQAFLDDAAERTEAPYFDKETKILTYFDDGENRLSMDMGGIYDPITDLGEGRVNEMKSVSLNTAVVGPSCGPELFGGENSIQIAKNYNDIIYKMTQDYPGRFIGSATLPVQDIDASIEELERCVNEYGFVAWHTHSNYLTSRLSDEQYLPLLQKAADLGVYVYLHPHAPTEPKLTQYGFIFAGAGWGFTEDTATTLLSLIANGTFDKIPNLKVVIGHMGEALPFMMKRMDNFFMRRMTYDTMKNEKNVSDYFRDNIYVTTSGVTSEEAFNLTKDVIGIDHIMVGTDYPYESLGEAREFLDSLDLTKEEREKLYYKNALQLIGKTDIAEDFAIQPLEGEPSDYSDENNWINIPEITKDVDTIYFYPTAYNEAGGDVAPICDIDNENMRTGAVDIYNKQATAFEESTNVFAPYYRQTNIHYLTGKSAEEFDKIQRGIQRTDMYASLDYYFENYNNGRPFIIAGHSQGAQMIKIALGEYFRAHPEYLERMVAAYPIGYSFTNEWLEENGYKFAEGADDTGVIVSWNTEGPENKGYESSVVLPGALAINPINWKRDDTYAAKEENLGSLVINDNGEREIIPGLNDAQIDTERGVVVCTTSDAFVPMPEIFGSASLHGQDYGLYYANIQENVKTRIDAYMKQK